MTFLIIIYNIKFDCSKTSRNKNKKNEEEQNVKKT